MALLLSLSPFFPKPAFQAISRIPHDRSRLSRRRSRRSRKGRTHLSSTRSMMASTNNPNSWVPFHKLLPAQRTLMETLITTVDTHLGPQLNPCMTPSDVRFFQNKDGTSLGSVNLRSGKGNSKSHDYLKHEAVEQPSYDTFLLLVRYILASWLHCELPFGSLDITTLMCMLNTNTDAPHFLLEIIQNSPTSVVLLVDLLPRRDLVRHPGYLKQFYEDTQLDLQRQKLEKLPVVQPYVSPLLSLRTIFSPSAILLKINCESQLIDGKTCSMEELIDQHLGNVVKEMMGIWLEQCASPQETIMNENERDYVLMRDNMMRNIGIDNDLRANLPRLFNSDIADRVLAALEKEV
ncbi:Red chlorophyll catabolite reductase [Nymphaea thermarum]|nr:Red chlorophyll catabolite reductase [Nymphaea thermarum]